MVSCSELLKVSLLAEKVGTSFTDCMWSIKSWEAVGNVGFPSRALLSLPTSTG